MSFSENTIIWIWTPLTEPFIIRIIHVLFKEISWHSVSPFSLYLFTAFLFRFRINLCGSPEPGVSAAHVVFKMKSNFLKMGSLMHNKGGGINWCNYEPIINWLGLLGTVETLCEKLKRNSKIPKRQTEIVKSEDRQGHGQQTKR